MTKNAFGVNLSLTQDYCRTQMGKQESDCAKVFRSFNPLHGSVPMFSFELVKYDFDIQSGVNGCTVTKWLTDPVGVESDYIVKTLFEQQITYKKKHVSIDREQIYKGDILIAEFDDTVTDGASEVESLGMIDIYDIPPIV